MKPFFLIICFIIPMSIAYGGWDNQKVAVLDIVSRVNKEKIDVSTISELFQVNLINNNSFSVLERNLIKKVLDEQKLEMSGLTENEITKVGKLVGADKIFTGSISKLANKYYLIIKGIDVRSGIAEISDQISGNSIEFIVDNILPLTERLIKKSQGVRILDSYITETIENKTNTIINEVPKSQINTNSYLNNYNNILSFKSDGHIFRYEETAMEIQLIINITTDSQRVEVKSLDGKLEKMPYSIDSIKIIGSMNNWTLTQNALNLFKLDENTWGVFLMKTSLPREGQFKILLNDNLLLEPKKEIRNISTDNKGNYNFTYSY